MNKKSTLIIVLLILFAGIFLVQSNKNTNPPDSTQEPTSQQTEQISEEQAIEIVSNLPEVKKWREEMSALNTKTILMAFKNDDDTWSVKLAESHPDRIVAANWFTIDALTGEVMCTMFDLKTGELNEDCLTE